MFDVIAYSLWALTGLAIEARSSRLGGQHLRSLAPAALFGPLWFVGNSGRRARGSAAAAADELTSTDGPGADVVVVGFGGNNDAAPAVRWAADRAITLGLPLRIVHAYTVTAAPSDAAGAYARVYAAAADRAERSLSDLRQKLGRSYPGLAIETVAASGPAAVVLERHCNDAALLVLATRQQSRLRQWISNSVTNRLTGRVRCPVVSVPLAPTGF